MVHVEYNGTSNCRLREFNVTSVMAALHHPAVLQMQSYLGTFLKVVHFHNGLYINSLQVIFVKEFQILGGKKKKKVFLSIIFFGV